VQQSAAGSASGEIGAGASSLWLLERVFLRQARELFGDKPGGFDASIEPIKLVGKLVAAHSGLWRDVT
jgi:hypothetical protein